MNFIPSSFLEKLYTRESLQNNGNGFEFKIKNRLSNAKLTEVLSAKVGSQNIELSNATLDFGNDKILKAGELKEAIEFPLGQEFTVKVNGESLPVGDFNVELNFVTEPFGKLSLKVKDSITA